MKKLLTLAAIVAATHCNAQYDFIKTSNRDYARIKSGDVQIIIDKDKVPKDAEEVGIIICKSNKDKKVYEKARSLAAKHGANCIYVSEKYEPTNSDKWRAATVGGGGGKDKTTFIAVRTKS